jgi:integrase
MSLYRRPGSPYWWSKLNSNGDVVRFSTRERTKIRALRVERDYAEEAKRRASLAGRYTVGTLAAKFAAWKEADGRAADTVKMIKRHLKQHVIPFLGADRDVRTVEVKDLEAYKAARAVVVGSITIGKELSTLRQLLRYGSEVHRVVEAAPTTRNPRQHYEPKWRLLTPDEVRAIFAALDAQPKRGRGRDAYEYFVLMGNTGMRGGELAALTWDMFDPAGDAVHLPGRITKSRRPRTVPLNAGARAATAALVARRPAPRVGRVFGARHYYTSWRNACAASKVGRVRPHDLRHTFGSLLHAAGRSGPEIRDILGHVTLAMENHYAHTYQARLHEAVAAVDLMPAPAPESIAVGHTGGAQ